MSIITPRHADKVVSGKPSMIDDGSPSSQRIIIHTVDLKVSGHDGDHGTPQKRNIIKQTAKV